MRCKRCILPLFLAVSVAGCAQIDNAQFTSHTSQTSGLSFRPDVNIEAQLSEQASALTKLNKDIIRKSTLRNAVIGSLAGCGVSVLAAGNGGNACLTGVAFGGAAGAAIGHSQGKKEAARRVEILPTSSLVRSISKSNDAMDEVRLGLPDFLAEQDRELAVLSVQRNSQEISEDYYQSRLEEMKQSRAELAQVLSLSAGQARQARQNLQEAVSRGQTGLDWHINATQHLERDSLSARAEINLL